MSEYLKKYRLIEHDGLNPELERLHDEIWDSHMASMNGYYNKY